MSHYESNLRDLELNLFEYNRTQDRMGSGPFAEMDEHDRSEADATPYAAATSPARRRRARLAQYGGPRGSARAGTSTGPPTARR